MKEIVYSFTSKKGLKFDVRYGKLNDIDEILKFQETIYNGIENKEILECDKREEYLDSINFNEVFLVYQKDELCGIFVIIKNRESDRNYYKLIKEIASSNKEVFAIDMAMVSKKYRGNKIQSEMIKFFINLAKKNKDIKYICATVSPKNKYSYLNLYENGFVNFKETNKIYGGLDRFIVIKEI